MEKIATLSERLVIVRELEHPDEMQRVLAAVYLLSTCRQNYSKNGMKALREAHAG